MSGKRVLNGRTSNEKRPTFSYKDQLVRAAGVLFYTIIDGRIQLLLYKDDHDCYQDFGGKTNSADHNYMDTAYRECQEETNGVITVQMLHTIDNKQDLLYNNSKYLLVCIKLDGYRLDRRGQELDLEDTTIFGDLEIYDNIPRTVHWVNYADLDKYNLHIRLDFGELYSFFNKLQTPLVNKPQIQLAKYRFYYKLEYIDKRSNKIVLKNRAQTALDPTSCANDGSLLDILRSKVATYNKITSIDQLKIYNISKWDGHNWINVFLEQEWPEI